MPSACGVFWRRNNSRVKRVFVRGRVRGGQLQPVERSPHGLHEFADIGAARSTHSRGVVTGLEIYQTRGRPFGVSVSIALPFFSGSQVSRTNPNQSICLRGQKVNEWEEQ